MGVNKMRELCSMKQGEIDELKAEAHELREYHICIEHAEAELREENERISSELTDLKSYCTDFSSILQQKFVSRFLPSSKANKKRRSGKLLRQNHENEQDQGQDTNSNDETLLSRKASASSRYSRPFNNSINNSNTNLNNTTTTTNNNNNTCHVDMTRRSSSISCQLEVSSGTLDLFEVHSQRTKQQQNQQRHDEQEEEEEEGEVEMNESDKKEAEEREKQERETALAARNEEMIQMGRL